MSSPERSQIVDLVRRFAEAFNRDDLDDVMSFFAQEALYAEFNGKKNRGKEAIRKAFEPQFQGAFGKIRFHEQDVLVDGKTRKAVIRWRCTVDMDGKPQAWEGLDILHFADSLITEKHTYAKADVPKLEDI